jgi:hypothetical protein
MWREVLLSPAIRSEHNPPLIHSIHLARNREEEAGGTVCLKIHQNKSTAIASRVLLEPE